MFDYDPRIASTDKQQIIKNIMNSFSSLYLTMISIVQGVALSLLAFKVPGIVKAGNNLLITWNWESFFNLLSIAFFILITFILIILTWHSYFWLASIARWVPIIWDSILFFLFGAFEFALIGSLSIADSFVWFYLFGIIGVVGGIQYLYNSKRLKDDEKENDKTTGVKKIKIWDNDVANVGKHIHDYKYIRGMNLLTMSLPFIIFVGILNFTLNSSVVPKILLTIIKTSLAFIILLIHFYFIKSHVDDQKRTLEYLTGVKDEYEPPPPPLIKKAILLFK